MDLKENLCEYGCGNEYKYLVGKKQRRCCSEKYNSCPALRLKNSIGVKTKYKNDPNYNQGHQGHQAWNKGLNKDTNDIIRTSSDSLRERYKTGELIHHGLGKKLSDNHRNNISIGMTTAHKENRAWNIGKSRWNNEPSYPEKFFMQVIENEFLDKCYIREYNVGRFSIDFAWVNKKLAIEIDGEQHYTIDGYKERDNRKDKTLIDNGWCVLRIRWIDMFKDTKKYISMAKEFIDG